MTHCVARFRCFRQERILGPGIAFPIGPKSLSVDSEKETEAPPSILPASAGVAPSATPGNSVALATPKEKNDAKVANADATAKAAEGNASDAGRTESVPHRESEESTDVRFRVRWGQKGFCGTKDSARLVERSALLSTFVPAEGSAGLVFYEPSVSPSALKAVQQALDLTIPRLPVGTLKSTSTPRTYVYNNIEQMRSVSCVNKAAIGYFDGAIHVVGDSRYGIKRIHETIIHEYIHSLLLERGIRLPMWFHEGMAMEFARERWWTDPTLGLTQWLLEQHLPFGAMATAFPSTADEKFALAVYYQSQMMFQFAFRDGAGNKLDTLIEGLAQGRVRSSDAFVAAVGLSGDALERAWREFLAEKENERRGETPIENVLDGRPSGEATRSVDPPFR